MSATFVGFWAGDASPFTTLPVERFSAKTHPQCLTKLREAEAVARTLGGVLGYDGSSTCRLCGLRNNGSEEFYLDGFVWPEGYGHYLEQHNVAIDPAFGKYLLDFDPHGVHVPTPFAVTWPHDDVRDEVERNAWTGF